MLGSLSTGPLFDGVFIVIVVGVDAAAAVIIVVFSAPSWPQIQNPLVSVTYLLELITDQQYHTQIPSNVCHNRFSIFVSGINESISEKRALCKAICLNAVNKAFLYLTEDRYWGSKAALTLI